MGRPIKFLSHVIWLICPPPYLLKALERHPFSAQDKPHLMPSRSLAALTSSLSFGGWSWALPALQTTAPAVIHGSFRALTTVGRSAPLMPVRSIQPSPFLSFVGVWAECAT